MSSLLRVNFIIAGAQKAGTTALAQFLSAHPDICFGEKKELHFFDQADFPETEDPAQTAERYHRLFPAFTGQAAVGEATPSYMFIPGVAERIHRYNPEMKIICLLRDPVERAISHYRMEVGRGRETLSLPLAVLLERFRIGRGSKDLSPAMSLRRYSYTSRGYYSGQLKRLIALFGTDRVLAIPTTTLWNAHEATLHQICDFIGVDPNVPLPARERIFSSAGNEPASGIGRTLLHLLYGPERKRLEQMGISL